MDPATVQMLVAGMNLAAQALTAYPTIRAGLSVQDQATLDLAYSQVREASNAVADRLRATPDDPV